MKALAGALLGAGGVAAAPDAGLLARIVEGHRLPPEAGASLERVLSGSKEISQGNPEVTRHPMTREECLARRRAAGLPDPWEEARAERICGAPHMAPLYDPAKEGADDASVCIDRFEFPGLPCEYPVVWIRADQAASACEAMGKRLCDAHEWEGACAGSVGPPDYRFDLASGVAPEVAVTRMRAAHNLVATRVWAYGQEYRSGLCASGSRKTEGCSGGSYRRCGSNTYPTGAFPDCAGEFGVYDLHGNAAEHMNLPLAPEEMAGTGDGRLGVTEMKGSWFLWDSYRAHPDWCRWRAPYWHGRRVRDPGSHHNYHLGFRCCRKTASGSSH